MNARTPGLDAADVMDVRLDRALSNVTSDIKRAFNSRGDVSLIGVPSFKAQNDRYTLIPFADAVCEVIEGYPNALKALVNVLANSDCKLVQELRNTLASEYTRAHAEDIAEVLA